MMKKTMELLVQFKFVWGLFFAASVVIYTIVNMLLGNTTMELIVIWQLFLISIIIVVLHYLIFGEFVLTKLSLKHKLLIHFPLCFVIILLFLNIFGWINFKDLSAMTYYTGAYIFFYIGILNSLYLYYKATGEELNSKLAIYKEKRNITNK